MLYKNEDDIGEKQYYIGEAVMLGYEAVTSDFYRYNENYLNNELGTKKKRMRMSSYELLIEACDIYKNTYVRGEYQEEADKLLNRLKELKEQYRK